MPETPPSRAQGSLWEGEVRRWAWPRSAWAWAWPERGGAWCSGGAPGWWAKGGGLGLETPGPGLWGGAVRRQGFGGRIPPWGRGLGGTEGR